MDAKWVPLLAAGFGVVGGVGGAVVGGWLANDAQKNQLESARQAAITDLRRATYAQYVGAVDAYVLTNEFADAIFKGNREGDQQAAVKFVAPQLTEALKAEAEVELVAKTPVARKAAHLRDKAGEPIHWKEYQPLRRDFIRAATHEIENED
jgi:hypothetical protein